MASQTALEANDKAPAFTLLNEDSQPVSLRDFSGKNVVLFFYPKADTPG
jgi:peroxiredoxin Q/BCP